MEITYALMQKFEELAEKSPKQAKLLSKARANKLLTNASGAVIGVQYEQAGQQKQEMAKAVVIATGGYGAGGLFQNSILQRERPDLAHLPTTNGLHCTGDGVDMAEAIGAASVDLKHIQVHPTGLVNPSDPDNRVLFLAAEALRGEGGIILDRNGKRFCNDLGTRDYVSGMMWKNQGPFRLCLNSKSSSKIAWHCKHYTGRGVMKFYKTGNDLAKEMNVSPDVLQKTFTDYNGFAKNGNDPWGKKFFDGVPLDVSDSWHVAIVTPVLHYTMGGVKIDADTRVVANDMKKIIPGLYSVGESAGGVHGKNRLGGSALCECIVLGRVAGKHIVKYIKDPASCPLDAIEAGIPGGAGEITNPVPPSAAASTGVAAAPLKYLPSSSVASIASAASPKAASAGPKTYTMEEVAKHNTDKDCWVAVNGQVLDVTNFLDDHPGGKMAIMTFAGKDASEEFNMLHEKNVIEKYAKDSIKGLLVGATKAKLWWKQLVQASPK